MKDGTSGSELNRYTTGVAFKAWHGSLNPSDSYVPFIVAYPGGNKAEIEAVMKDACPNNEYPGNWNLADVVKKIISVQYK